MRCIVGVLMAVTVAACSGDDPSVPLAEGETPTFDRRVAPLFEEHCNACHGGSGYAAGGWDGTSYSSALESGDGGPAVVPGDPDASRLVRSMRGEDGVMPPAGPLPADVRRLVEDWIEAGAPER
jgi:hypothetical protein